MSIYTKPKVICEFCLQYVTAGVKHPNYCKDNPNKKIKKSPDFTITETNCNFCNKPFTNSMSLSNHSSRCKDNPNRKIQVLTDSGRAAIIKSNKETVWSDERRKKQSNSMKLAVLKYPDSYSSNNVCGRVKIHEYNGNSFHGSWEVIVAKWLDLNNIEWIRNTSPIEYIWNNDTHQYFPDFYLPKLDLYLEVKGYERDRDLCKWNSIENIVIIRSHEINLINEGKFSCDLICGGPPGL